MKMQSLLLMLLIAGVLALLLLVIRNHLPAAEPENDYDRVVFIPGIKTMPVFLGPWKVFLKFHFPNAERVFIEGNYHYNNIQSVVDIQQKVIQELEQEKGKTLVIVHSYGGIQIVAAIQNSLAAGNNVDKIIALSPAFDPAVDNFLGPSKKAINYSFEPISQEMKIICGSFDRVVPCASTAFPGVENRTWVVSGHSTFLVPQLFGGRTVLNQ